MSKNTLKIIGLLVLGIFGIVGLVSTVSSFVKGKGLGGIVGEASYLLGDVYQGTSQVLMMQNGVFVGPISTANSSTFSGSSVFSALVTMTGIFNPDSIGSGVLTLAATSTAQTLTAANLCDNRVVDWPLTTSTGAITLPTAVSLQADCLDTMGSSRDIIIRNTDTVATSSITTITAGASSTILSNFATSSQSALAIPQGKAVKFTFVPVTSTQSNATMIHILADIFN